MRKIDVIVTEASFPTSLWVAKSLKLQGLMVCGLDIYKGPGIYSNVYDLKLIKKSYNEIYEFIESCYSENPGIVVFPHYEKVYLELYKRAFKGIVVAPPENISSWIVDKNKVLEVFVRLGLGDYLPKTMIFRSEDILNFEHFIQLVDELKKNIDTPKVIIKLGREIDIPYGPDSRYFILDNNTFSNQEILKSKYEILRNQILKFGVESVICQEYISGYSVAVGGVWHEGKAVIIGGHKRERMSHSTGGVSTAAKFYYEKRLWQIAKEFMESIKYTGIAMLEFLYDHYKDKYYFIEINPRIWGTLPLYIKSGVDVPNVAYNLFKFNQTKNFDEVTYNDDKVIVYFYENLLSIIRDDNMTKYEKILEIIKSLRFIKNDPLVSIQDPLPFIFKSLAFLKGLLRRKSK